MREKRFWLLAVLGCAAVTPPLHAQSTDSGTSPPLPARVAVDSFYTSRPGAVVWFRSADTRAAAAKLPALLRRAEIDRLADLPALAAGVEAAIASGQAADERIISAAWVAYVQELKAPVPGVHYGDPALTLHAPSADTILAEAARAPSLMAHVDQIAAVNPLYSKLRDAAQAQGSASDLRVRASLERLRMIPATGRAILVDPASARLWMLEDGRAIDSMKVIVGKTKSPTTMMAGTIHYITYNPYWNIPDDVARTVVAPLVIKRGVKYLKAARYVTAEGFGQKAELVDAATIDWKAVRDGSAPVHLRQLPGENNMMGSMKFGFVNDYDIFLHDTPRKKLFEKDRRTLSMGCIRLEQADRLARWMLGREPEAPSSDPEQHVQLEKGVPVFVSYLTASVEDGKLAYAEDVYGLDPAVELASTAPAATAN
jgi:murein L,D-transpeptidase YcbB/YkuD